MLHPTAKKGKRRGGEVSERSRESKESKCRRLRFRKNTVLLGGTGGKTDVRGGRGFRKGKRFRKRDKAQESSNCEGRRGGPRRLKSGSLQALKKRRTDNCRGGGTGGKKKVRKYLKDGSVH